MRSEYLPVLTLQNKLEIRTVYFDDLGQLDYVGMQPRLEGVDMDSLKERLKAVNTAAAKQVIIQR